MASVLPPNPDQSGNTETAPASTPAWKVPTLKLTAVVSTAVALVFPVVQSDEIAAHTHIPSLRDEMAAVGPRANEVRLAAANAGIVRTDVRRVLIPEIDPKRLQFVKEVVIPDLHPESTKIVRPPSGMFPFRSDEKNRKDDSNDYPENVGIIFEERPDEDES